MSDGDEIRKRSADPTWLGSARCCQAVAFVAIASASAWVFAEPPEAIIQASVLDKEESFDGRRQVHGGYLTGVQRRTARVVAQGAPMIRLGPDVVEAQVCLHGISQDGRYEVKATLQPQPSPRPVLVRLPDLPLEHSNARGYLRELSWNDFALLVSHGACGKGARVATYLPLFWEQSESGPIQVAVNGMGAERVAARLIYDSDSGEGQTLTCRRDHGRRTLGFDFRCLADDPIPPGHLGLVLLLYKHGTRNDRVEVSLSIP